MIELRETEHPWFVACQFHPEFTSTPRTGHPLFKAFIKAAIDTKGKRAPLESEKTERQQSNISLVPNI